MTRTELIDYALSISGAATDCPFEEKTTVVLRHCDTGKWFGLLMLHNGEDILNLKCEPMNADFLRKAYEGVIPAYHINKVHWNTVILQSDVPDGEIMNMVSDSFWLTAKKSARKKVK